MRIAGALILITALVGRAEAAATCDPIRLEGDMACCLMLSCGERDGSRSVIGAVRGAPTNQALFNLRRGFSKCQALDQRNNFYACERLDRKGPYNTGRRLLGLPPG